MRNHSSVKFTLTLALLCAVSSLVARADEATDRTAIEQAIAGLNQFPRPVGLFTEEATNDLVLLPKVRFMIVPARGMPTLTISHEPFGEAHLDPPAAKIINPRIASGAIRFLTPDIALVDGFWNFSDGASAQRRKLFFVIQRDGDAWRIASARVLAPADSN